jgi:hypothetical protein
MKTAFVVTVACVALATACSASPTDAIAGDDSDVTESRANQVKLKNAGPNPIVVFRVVEGDERDRTGGIGPDQDAVFSRPLAGKYLVRDSGANVVGTYVLTETDWDVAVTCGISGCWRTESIGKEGAATDECTPGTAYDWPAFEETLPPVATGSTEHESSHAYSFDGMQVPPTRPGSTAVAWVGATIDGNWQYMDRTSWKVCAGQLVIEAGAAVQFGGGGLSASELQACADDLSLPVCSTIARYCAGPLSLAEPTGPRCALKPEITVKASFAERPSP